MSRSIRQASCGVRRENAPISVTIVILELDRRRSDIWLQQLTMDSNF